MCSLSASAKAEVGITPTPASRLPVWVVTGASSGLGQAVALEAAKSATVIAIGRNQDGLNLVGNAGCRTVVLDLRGSSDHLDATVQSILEQEGRVDVLVNAAGYILEGAIEETNDEELVDIFNTNVFAPICLTRAVLPHMRQAGRGIIVNVAGLGGLNGSPNAGFYCASKSALSTLTESLQRETDPLGIRVCLVQLGHFRTAFLKPDHRLRVGAHIPDYDPVLEPLRSAFNDLDGTQPGDPKKAAAAIVEVVRGGQEAVPFLLALGPDVLATELSSHQAKRDAFSRYQKITNSTDL